MRLVLAFAAAQSLGLLFHSSDAFAPATTTGSTSSTSLFPPRKTTLPTTTSSSLLQIGAADPDDIPTSEDSIEGAELTADMRAKMKDNNDKDEEYGGGTKFKQLLEAAKRAEKTSGGEAQHPAAPKSLRNPFADNPFAGIEGLDPTMGPTTSGGANNNLNPDEMTVEQQAEMFRQMMAGKNQQQQQAPPPIIDLPKARPPKPDAKYGRNRDADAIQNTADVYFAQLKRDSTVRGIARIRGDDETANAVFKDPKIEELKDLISVNPGSV